MGRYTSVSTPPWTNLVRRGCPDNRRFFCTLSAPCALDRSFVLQILLVLSGAGYVEYVGIQGIHRRLL